MITLSPLPYASDALAPHISKDTLETHHGKHHAGYVKKTNTLCAEAGLSDLTLEAVIARAAGDTNAKLFNQAAQVWNHAFYWHSLSPKRTAPDAALADAIARDFGSQGHLVKELSQKAAAHFGSGWVWLSMLGGKLCVMESHDAATLAIGDAKPLLVIDVWEHAYYLDRRNARDAYLAAVTEDLLNWRFASDNFARAEPWTYSS